MMVTNRSQTCHVCPRRIDVAPAAPGSLLRVCGTPGCAAAARRDVAVAALLIEHGWLTVADVRELTGMDAPAARRALGRMHRHGWVEISPLQANGRRAYRVTAAPATVAAARIVTGAATSGPARRRDPASSPTTQSTGTRPRSAPPPAPGIPVFGYVHTARLTTAAAAALRRDLHAWAHDRGLTAGDDRVFVESVIGGRGALTALRAELRERVRAGQRAVVIVPSHEHLAVNPRRCEAILDDLHQLGAETVLMDGGS